jgi:hypothetical protein
MTSLNNNSPFDSQTNIVTTDADFDHLSNIFFQLEK